jgi:hypothetical protein
MSFDLRSVNPSRTWQAEPARGSAPAPAGGTPTGPAAHGVAATADTFPASPPPELRKDILVAQRAVQEMYERGRELHFDIADGRLRIELRDLDGNVLKTIPPFQALEIAGGKAVE